MNGTRAAVTGCAKGLRARGARPDPKRILSWLLTVLAVVGAARMHALATRIPAADFFQFWALGQAVDEGLVGDIYDPAARRHLARVFVRRSAETGDEAQRAAAGVRSRELEAASTPFLYTVFHAFQTGRYERDVGLYRAVSVGLSLVAIAWLCRLLRVDPLRTSAALAFATWAWVPLGEDLADGNVNQLQLASLALFLALQRRAPATAPAVAAGAVLGVSSAFKPNLAFVLAALTLGWLVDRAGRRLLCCWSGALLGAAGAAALSIHLFDTPRPWLDWLALLRGIDAHYDLGVAQGNFGGARLLGEPLGWNPAWLLQLVGWGLLLRALLAERARERAPEDAFRREYLVVAAGAILPLLTTSLAWPHYLMLAVPSALYVLVAPTPARADPRRIVPALVAVLCVLASFPYSWWAVGGPFLHAGTRALAAASLFWAAVAELRGRSGARPAGV